MNSTTDIVWLQDNLRVADNPLLHFTSAPDQLVCLYVLDQAWLTSIWQAKRLAALARRACASYGKA